MFGDKMNLMGLLKNAKKIQGMMEDAQAELEKIEVQGEAGAGAVKVTMNARHYILKIDYSDEILKESKEVLQDLAAAAINDAVRKVETITKEKMMDFGKFLNVDSNKDE